MVFYQQEAKTVHVCYVLSTLEGYDPEGQEHLHALKKFPVCKWNGQPQKYAHLQCTTTGVCKGLW